MGLFGVWDASCRPSVASDLAPTICNVASRESSRAPATQVYRIKALEPRPQPKRTRRAMMRGWLREESFWKDVATRTVAGAFVGIGAYLFAVSTGYLQTPTGWQTTKGAATVIAFILFLVGSFWATFLYSPERHKHRKLWQRRAIKVFAFVLALYGSLGVMHSMTGMLNDSWVWPFNTPGWHVEMAPPTEGK